MFEAYSTSSIKFLLLYSGSKHFNAYIFYLFLLKLKEAHVVSILSYLAYFGSSEKQFKFLYQGSNKFLLYRKLEMGAGEFSAEPDFYIGK